MCYSLPNVIRIMVEEHGFHATPKMFQVQIYKKWDLRKGRPESNKKSRKRRRIAEEDEEDEEDEDDDQDDDIRPAQRGRSKVSGGGSAKSMSPNNTLTLPHRVDGRQFPVELQLTQAAAMPKSHIQQMALEIAGPGSLRAGLEDLKDDLDGPIPIPDGWEEFYSRVTNPTPVLVQDAEVVTESQLEDPQSSFSYGTGPTPADRASRWMNIVMESSTSEANPPKPAHSSAASHVSGSSSGRSRGSYALSRSSGSRSNASGSRWSSTSSRSCRCSASSKTSSRSSATTMTLPPGSLRDIGTPAKLLLPEKSMFYARHYISSTFSTGIWIAA